MIISFIVPIHNEEQNINHLFSEMLKIKDQLKEEVEFIYIDDGSSDNSLNLLTILAHNHPFVKIISFSRNFSQQIALSAGLDFARGHAVIMMDADMQDPPEVSLEMIKKWHDGYQIVYGQRKNRCEKGLKKMAINLFYWLFNKITDVHMPSHASDFRLLDRQVVEELKKFREHNRLLRGLSSFVGFKQTAVLYDRTKRQVGKTHFPIKRMIRIAIDGLTGFSTTPLHFITYFGIIAAFLSFLTLIIAIILKLTLDISGLIIVIIVILFINSLQILMLGIIAEYLSRMNIESKHRPLYIIKKTLNITHDKKNN